MQQGSCYDDEHVLELLQDFPELKDGRCGMYDVTALQVVAALSKSGVSDLISCNGDVNQADFLGRTPLHYAAGNGNVALMELLLEEGAGVECAFRFNHVVAMTDEGRWNALLAKLPSPDGWGRRPLHVAVKHGHVEAAKLLIFKGANVNAKDSAGLTPLLLAGCNQDTKCFEDMVQILVGNCADVNVRNNVTGTTTLFHAVALKSLKATEILLEAGAWITENLCKQTELHEAASKGLLDILELFLKDPRINLTDINKVDDRGRSPLNRAAYGGYKDCVRLLIEKGADMGQVSFDGETIALLIFRNVAKPAEFVNQLLDSQVRVNGSAKCSESFNVTLDFKILAPQGEDNQMRVLAHILEAANTDEKIEILQHPLIETYLLLKWNRIRPFFLLQLFSHILFVISLSAFSLLLVQQSVKFETALMTFRVLLTVTSSGLLAHNIIQCALVGRTFFRQHELLMNFSCTSVSLLVALLADTTLGVPIWILHVTSIAVLLSWTELMLLIGRFPTYGYYALMFSVVFRNVIKVLLTFMCLILGFALSFSIQFHSSLHFKDPWKSAVKTVTMMMGEYEYSDLFGHEDAVVPRLVATSRIIFLLFIILASIVLMNLMVGVAVSDIQRLQIEGHAKRLEKQAEFIRQLEKVISFKIVRSKWFPQYLRKFLRRKCCVRTKLVLYPEMRWSWKNRSIFKHLPCCLIERVINIALARQENENQEESDKLKELDNLIDLLSVLVQKLEGRRLTATNETRPGKYRKVSFEHL